MISVGLTWADEIRACADRVAVCIAGPSFTNCPCLSNLHPPHPSKQSLLSWWRSFLLQGTFWDHGEEFWSVKSHESKTYFSLLMDTAYFFKKPFLEQYFWFKSFGVTPVSMAREGILHFLFATTALPGFQSEGNSLIHDSVTAHWYQPGPYRWPWVSWHNWKNPTAWK